MVIKYNNMRQIFTLMIIFVVVVPSFGQLTPTDGTVFAQDGSFKPLQGQTYIISAWVLEDHNQGSQPFTYENTQIDIVLSVSETITFSPTGDIIDGWQRIIGTFTIPDNSMIFELKLKSTDFEIDSYFDDVRIYPFNGNMKSFVYDSLTQRLMAELDENNYATFYEYDAEGGLVRVKKETERGIQTIQETRSKTTKGQ